MKTYEKILEEERQRWITYNRLLKNNNSAVESTFIKNQMKQAELTAFRMREVLNQRKQNEPS